MVSEPPEGPIVFDTGPAFDDEHPNAAQRSRPTRGKEWPFTKSLVAKKERTWRSSYAPACIDGNEARQAATAQKKHATLLAVAANIGGLAFGPLIAGLLAGTRATLSGAHRF